MAQSGLIDNMLTVGLIINTLPTEIKYLIISHIPIKNLVSAYDTEVNPIIDNYIKDYIDTKLLTDASTFTFLRKTNLYEEIVYIKIHTLAKTIAKDFIQMCDDMKDLPVSESTERFVSLTIKYRDEVQPFNNNIKSIIRYKLGDYNDRMIFEKYFFHTTQTKMNNVSIIFEIIETLELFMDNLKNRYQSSRIKRSFQLDSIKLVGFTKEDTLEDDVRFLKKYY
jgi:hypothetical protein